MLVPGVLSLAFVAAMATAGGAPDSGSKPVAVEFDAPDGCSSADAFWATLRSRTDRVRRALGAEARTTLQVRLTRGHGRVVGELRMIDDHGGSDTRKVDGASCDEVAQALSLTAALALDPMARLSPGAPAPSAEADAPDAASKAEPAPDVSKREEKPAPAPPEDEPTRPPRPVPSLELTAGALVSRVLSGGASSGLALGVRKIFAADLHPSVGLAIVYARNDVVAAPGAAKTGLAALAGSFCPVRWTASVVTIEPCALALAGWLSATGQQVTHSNTADRFWLSAGGSLRAAVFLGAGLSVEAEGGITAPLLERRFFTTTPKEVVAESPTVSPIVGLALTYGF